MSIAELARTTPIAPGVRNRILILDVERVMPEYRIRSWSRKFDRYLSYDQLVTDARTSLVAWSWYDEDEIHAAAEWDKGGRNQFLRKIHRVMEQADIIVTHNGANADEPWLLADFTVPRKGAPGVSSFRRLPELPPWKTVDTLKTMRSKRYKGIDFKALDAVCQIAGLPGKTDRYDYELMDAAVAGDREAQERITAYCKGDVAAERFVYDWLRPGMANHPHMFVEGKGALVVCNRCASAETLPNAKRWMANVQSYEMLRLRDLHRIPAPVMGADEVLCSQGRVIVTCRQCEVPIARRSKHGNDPIFCSPKCRSKWHYENDRERANEHARKWRAANRERVRWLKLRSQYGPAA